MEAPASEQSIKSGILLSTPDGPLKIDFVPAIGRSISGKNPFLSLVVPTYNEARNVEAMIRQITALLDDALPNNYELIIVDDDSPDRTWEIAEPLLSEFPHLRIMRRVGERGLSSAVIRGWQAARGEVLGVIDGDLQHPPEVLLQLKDAIADGADLAVASRHVDGGGVGSWSMLRRALSRGAQMIALLLLPEVASRVSDPMSGYFMVRRSAIAGAELHPVGYKILIEVIGRGAIRAITEVGFVFRERLEGESKVTLQQYVDYLRHLVRLRLSLGRAKRAWQIVSNLPFERFARFAVVGSSGVLVDMAILYLLHDPHSLGLGLTRSKLVAAEFAIMSNFFWNDRWTFGDLQKQQSPANGRIKRFLKFNSVCLLGLALNVVVLNIFYNVVGLDYRIANLMAIALVTLWNFWLNYRLSWKVEAPAMAP